MDMLTSTLRSIEDVSIQRRYVKRWVKTSIGRLPFVRDEKALKEWQRMFKPSLESIFMDLNGDPYRAFKQTEQYAQIVREEREKLEERRGAHPSYDPHSFSATPPAAVVFHQENAD